MKYLVISSLISAMVISIATVNAELNEEEIDREIVRHERFYEGRPPPPPPPPIVPGPEDYYGYPLDPAEYYRQMYEGAHPASEGTWEDQQLYREGGSRQNQESEMQPFPEEKLVPDNPLEEQPLQEGEIS